LRAARLINPPDSKHQLLASIYGYDADKHDQFTQDFEWFKSTGFGTHEIRFGYSLNHLFNTVQQAYSGPYVRVFSGLKRTVLWIHRPGQLCCYRSAYNQANLRQPLAEPPHLARAHFGYIRARDYQTLGSASSWNHGLSMYRMRGTVHRNFTINAGVRFDKEYLPAYPQSVGFTGHPIDFGFWRQDRPAPA